MAQNISSLSQLKKALSKGSRFLIVDHFRVPERTGDIREVTVAQSNAIYSIIPEQPNSIISKANNGRGARMEYTKASDYTFTDDGIIHISYNGQPMLNIKLIEQVS